MSSSVTRRSSNAARASHGEPEKYEESRGLGSRKGKKTISGRTATNVQVSDTGKEALLVMKQADLESIYQKHDSLVREIFHLEHFRSMIGYDPEEAKKDESAVFHDYKSTHYDILNKINSVSTSIAGPSRRTRSAQQSERFQLLQSASAPPNISSPVKLPAKVKRKWKDNSSVWDILASARNKIKGKEKVEDAVPDQTTSHNGFAGVEAGESISVGLRKGKVKCHIAPEPSSISRNGTRSTSTASSLSGIKRTTPAPPVVVIASQSKRRKIDDNLSTLSNDVHDPGGTLTTHNQQTKSSSTPLQRTRSISGARGRATTTVSSSTRKATQAATTSSPSNIRRIKLIVRRPPPLLSNPRQKPPPPQFSGSVSNLLHSFTTLGDREANDETIQKQIREKAQLLEKAYRLRKDGRYFPDAEILEAEVTAASTSGKRVERHTKDVWDYCIEEVVKYRQTREQALSGQQIARQIATMIQSYWEVQAVRQEKWKAQEEKRLRALAKATIKMVTAEWKKAVFHLREQERLRREQEELRRGHEHLDAILNQSGHILETQHIDLSRSGRSRSRSRASSASTDLEHWDQEADDDGDGSNESSETEGNSDDDTESDGFPESAGIDEDGGDEQSTSMMLLQSDRSQEIPYGGPSSVHSKEPLSTSARVSPASGMGVIFTASKAISGSPPTDAGSTMDEAVDSTLSSSNQDGGHSLVSPIGNNDLIPGEKSENVPQEKMFIPAVASTGLLSLDDSEAANPSTPSSSNSPILFTDAELMKEHSDQFVEEASTPQSAAMTESGTIKSGGVESVYDVTTPSSIEVQDVDLLASAEVPEHDEDPGQHEEDDTEIPEYLKPYLVAPVHWDSNSKLSQPLLLRGILRPYQFSGLEWLASLHSNNLNGILADEMGLGKTIQTISLLAHLACDRGIWGPHLIIVPTSVLLNWEMEFKKFLPGFRILSYHGNTKRRKELRQGWNDKLHFNVCITSYTLASRDAHIFKRKAWYYMILDEAHMIKNFKSQRWNILLMFRSFRRLLLTGTPLQNNLTELWALLQFLMSGTNFANLKEFGDWFSNPLEKAVEMGNILDDETMQRVSKLHTVLRPYLLRRLKRDVEKELPSKYEHLVLCPLSKRQRFLYDEFMSRAQTRDALQSGVYQKIANILMQLRKVCNHPDLFEVRPIVTSFAMQKSAIADFEIKELLVRRRLLYEDQSEKVNLSALGLSFINQQGTSLITALEARRLDATQDLLAQYVSDPGIPPPKDTRTIKGFKAYSAWQKRAKVVARWAHLGYLNSLRCNNGNTLFYSFETLSVVQRMYEPIVPTTHLKSNSRMWALKFMNTVTRVHDAVLSYSERAESMKDVIERFAFVTPTVVALDLPRIAMCGSISSSYSEDLEQKIRALPDSFDAPLHLPAVKLQIAFPDPSLLQYDCGKLQMLSRLLREKKAGGHRALIFTQMTRILDLLEIFLNFHGWLYLRLDGATKIEDRQYLTERFNRDDRIFCFISSSRSGGVGINLTGADTVIFYDSDFNPQMDRQCEDRAHRIGQIRDVHIYRFVSQHTVEEAMLRKANQKRSLDDLVIQKGGFDWRTLFGGGEGDEEGEDNLNSKGAESVGSSGRSLLTKALEEFEDVEDTNAARIAEREEGELVGADEADFGNDEKSGVSRRESTTILDPVGDRDEDLPMQTEHTDLAVDRDADLEPEEDMEAEEEGGTVVDYMLAFVQSDAEFFEGWSIR